MSLDFQVLLCYHFSQLGMLKYSWKAELVFFFFFSLNSVSGDDAMKPLVVFGFGI